jgi:MFS family permease
MTKCGAKESNICCRLLRLYNDIGKSQSWGLGMCGYVELCLTEFLPHSGIGIILSTLTVGHFLDWYLLYNTRLGKHRSESRLLPMILGSICVPRGILSFGWTVQYNVHWIIPIICSSLVGFGYVSMAISAWIYLLDIFGIYAAPATASTVLLRNAGAAGLPLAGPPLVGKIDWGWGFSVLALIGFLTIPIPVSLIYTG